MTFYVDALLTFMIGGKSAVLSAITIGLGGKAHSTGRGNGLKAFIREGQKCVCFLLVEVTCLTRNLG